MSRRTRRKLNNIWLYLIKYVFNSRYIIRNTMAATALCTVIAAICGLSSIHKSNEEQKTDSVDQKVVAEQQDDSGAAEVSIQLTATSMMSADSVSILMAGLDTDTKTDVQPKKTQVVAEQNTEIFVAIEDGVNIRETASTEAEVVGALYLGDTGKVLEDKGEWLHISFQDVDGYVKAEFVLTGKDAEAYIAEHADDESQEEDKEESEETSTQEEDDNDSDDADSTTEQQTTEAQDDDQNDTTEASEPEEEPGSGATEVGTTYRDPVTLSESDINLMASVMTLECGGESYAGQLAVANVILNRYLSGAYGSTMSDVCYAPGQFAVVSSPQFQTYVENGAQASCLQAAREALSGVNNIGSYTQFRPVSNVNPDNYSSYTIIGNHIFF